ncbi:hypothetical protein BB559_004328 [Furculomyces boomerangus]|uniref:UspA domain-containing protein n=2 Tax=Harpellales TaxID=61421 RepID=A0A2T9YFK5_9FUNG|nr:hypothetical protein BB559_004328 [Furculomyces boomerangus]PVZ99559.1 hypothetical protein BB558_004481 [Smittium angustum]
MASAHPKFTIHENSSTSDELFHPHGHGKRVIAVSVDDKTNSDEVIDWALEHIIDKDSDFIVLIHVRLSDRAADFSTLGGYIDDPHGVEKQKEHSHEILSNYGHKLQEAGCHVKAYSLVGEPGHEIVKKTTELKADHLVMGTRGLSSVKKMFLGSVSEYCSKHCTCGISVVKTH